MRYILNKKKFDVRDSVTSAQNFFSTLRTVGMGGGIKGTDACLPLLPVKQYLLSYFVDVHDNSLIFYGGHYVE